MKNEINSLIKEAMISNNKVDLSVFRFIKNEFTKFETAEKKEGVSGELTEEAEQQILTKMVKDREVSVSEYNKAGRPELAQIELNEIEVLKRFLPKEPTKAEMQTYLDEIFTSENRNMGEYIKKLKEKFPVANGKTIADLVKEKLTT